MGFLRRPGRERAGLSFPPGLHFTGWGCAFRSRIYKHYTACRRRALPIRWLETPASPTRPTERTAALRPVNHHAMESGSNRLNTTSRIQCNNVIYALLKS